MCRSATRNDRSCTCCITMNFVVSLLPHRMSHNATTISHACASSTSRACAPLTHQLKEPHSEITFHLSRINCDSTHHNTRCCARLCHPQRRARAVSDYNSCNKFHNDHDYADNYLASSNDRGDRDNQGAVETEAAAFDHHHINSDAADLCRYARRDVQPSWLRDVVCDLQNVCRHSPVVQLDSRQVCRARRHNHCPSRDQGGDG
jgi:hypothetical protein